jgi:hypothetical protein
MATTYFLCGGPYVAEGEPNYLFPGFKKSDKKAKFWDTAERGEIVYAVCEDIWVVTGDPNHVHSLGPYICPALSNAGKAGEFYEQSNTPYCEIVLYKRGRETDRLLYYPDDPQYRGATAVPNLDIDDLWERSQEMLPKPWEEVYELEGSWWDYVGT